MLLAPESATLPAARRKRRLVLNRPMIVGCSAAAIFLALSLLQNGFLSPNNLINLVHDVAVLGILSVGTATGVIGGGIDLSMVSIIGVSIALLFVLVADGVPAPLAIALTAGAALLSGAANGALIAYVEISPLDDRLAGEVVMMTCSAPCALDEDRRAEAAAALNGYGIEFRCTNDVAVGDEAERGDGRQIEAVCL
jgi:ABC-type xylose transport system permease subunit